MYTVDDEKVRAIAKLLKEETDHYRSLDRESLESDQYKRRVKFQMQIINIVGGHPLALDIADIMQEYDKEDEKRWEESVKNGEDPDDMHNYVGFFDYMADNVIDNWYM